MKELTIPAKIDCLNQVLSFVTETLEEAGCSMKTQMAVEVATEEIFANIAHYAYRTADTPEGKDPVNPGDVTIQAEAEAQTAVITFIDNGTPYNPLARKDPDITLNAEERDVGGLGILMVKKTMDDVSYAYRDGQNILTIKKHW